MYIPSVHLYPHPNSRTLSGNRVQKEKKLLVVRNHQDEEASGGEEAIREDVRDLRVVMILKRREK